MVHGSVFPSQLPEHTNEVDAKEQGEGGDWYEVSRYGAFTTPSLCAYICLLSLTKIMETN